MNDSQSQLMAAIAGTADHTTPLIKLDKKGLEVYQNNLVANAVRALSISYPTIFTLLGEELFRQTTRQYLQDCPLNIGDWGLWGSDLSQWLNGHDLSSEYPYLADCAHLDWRVHMCERSADPNLALESLQELASPNAGQGRFTFHPSLCLIPSDYPIVDIWQAHNTDQDRQPELLQKARQKLEQQKGQTALLWRKQWQAQVREASSAEAAWIQALLDQCSIDDALQACQSTDFQFEQWLPDAITEHIVTGFSLPTRP